MSNVMIPKNSTPISQNYETSDYSIFKTLHGNRKLNSANIKTLTTSMNLVGWIGAPAVINERYEVIDGQNRIEAAKASQVPVQFTIRDGYRIQECIALNQNGVKWNTTDYTESWAKQGLDAYQWLLELQQKYPCFSLDDLTALCYNKARTLHQSPVVRHYFRDGKFEMTDAEKLEVETVVEWLSKFDTYVRHIGGRKFIMYNAILFCYYSDTVDNDRLFDKVFVNNYHKINPALGIQGYLHQIEAIYNSSLKIPAYRIHVEADFLNAKISTREYHD